MRPVVGLLLVGVALVGSAAPASALDADHRLGQTRTSDVVQVHVAPLRPHPRCLRVRTVPVVSAGQRNLLLVPCQDVQVPEPVRPWGDRPPIVIPVEGRG